MVEVLAHDNKKILVVKGGIDHNTGINVPLCDKDSAKMVAKQPNASWFVCLSKKKLIQSVILQEPVYAATYQSQNIPP